MRDGSEDERRSVSPGKYILLSILFFISPGENISNISRISALVIAFLEIMLLHPVETLQSCI